MPTCTLIPIHLGKINLDLGIMTYRERNPQKRHYWKVVPPGNFINLHDDFNRTLRLKGMADILIPQHDPSLFEIQKIPG